jgi:hypothetical protein
MKQDLKYPIAKDKITNKLVNAEVLNGKIVIVLLSLRPRFNL